MPVLFEVPLNDLSVQAWQAGLDGSPRFNAERALLHGDAASGVVVTAPVAQLHINIAYKDFRTKYPTLIAFFAVGKTAAAAAQLPPEGFATLALAPELKRQLDDSRDAVRNTVFADPDPATQTGIDPAMDQAQGINQLLGVPGSGFCLGTAHDDPQTKEMLCDMIDSGALNGGLLFIEEIPTVLQQELSDWLTDGLPASPLPANIRAVTGPLDEQLDRKNGGPVAKNFTAMLQKAKAQNIKVFGIDGGDADPGVPPDHPGFHERRDVKMNALAKGVIEQARIDNPGVKFVATVGDAHVNTHPGGVPGIAQLFGIPGVNVDPATGKMVPKPDDQALRGMPSRAEQAFIDQYTNALHAGIGDGYENLGDVRPRLPKDLYTDAAALARQLALSGDLPDVGSVDAAMQRPEVTQRLADIVKIVAKAGDTIEPGDLDTLANAAIDTGLSSLSSLMLHHAAGLGDADIAEDLITNGHGDPNARNMKGQTALHIAVRKRRDEAPAQQRQADMTTRLLLHGANPDAADGSGMTASHHAALNGNVLALTSLRDGMADQNLQDGRGWTPFDVSVATTKPNAEQFFYDNGLAQRGPNIDLLGASVDTVEALIRATKCENPADLAVVQQAYEKLYAIPELRPMLKLLALDSMNPREMGKTGGLRIVIASDNNVGGLYANERANPPTGAYEENAHVLMVSRNGAGDFAGTLAHEMTHAAGRIAIGDDTVAFHGNETVPFDGDLQRGQFDRAIAEDVKNTALLLPDGQGGPMETSIRDRMTGRMNSYVQRYPDEAQLKLHQEFLAGIPQLIAEYGPNEVRKLSPELTKYFETTFTEKVNQQAQDVRYDAVRNKIDDAPLANLVVVLPDAPPAWTATGDHSAQTATDMIRNYATASLGQPRGDGLLYQPDHFEIPPNDQALFAAKMLRVNKAIRQAFGEAGLPPELSGDALRGLTLQITGMIEHAQRPRELDDMLASHLKTWVRDTKLAYVQHCQDTNVVPSDHALAEAVVIEAENQTWLQGDGGRSTDLRDLEVNRDKHQQVVRKLAGDLGHLGQMDKANPMALVQRLSGSLVGPDNGFYRKPPPRFGSSDPEHISIDKTAARERWLQQLGAL